MEATSGRIVHYRIGTEPDGTPARRPAIVVRHWPDGHGVNLQVFLDGSNDVRYREEALVSHRAVAERGEQPFGEPYAQPTPEECARGFAWRTSAPEGDHEGAWIWPPRT